MAVESRARLGLVVGDSFHDATRKRGLQKGFDERSTLTERRRHLVHDHAGGKRPAHFLGEQKVSYMRDSRHSRTLRLRRLERRVMFWNNFWDAVFGVFSIFSLRKYS